MRKLEKSKTLINFKVFIIQIQKDLKHKANFSKLLLKIIFENFKKIEPKILFFLCNHCYSRTVRDRKEFLENTNKELKDPSKFIDIILINPPANHSSNDYFVRIKKDEILDLTINEQFLRISTEFSHIYPNEFHENIVIDTRFFLPTSKGFQVIPWPSWKNHNIIYVKYIIF
jgi:hypothetical protein